MSTRIREPHAFAKLSASVVEMALFTGVVARLYRALVLSRTETSSTTIAAAALTLGAIYLLLMAALHLSRFPLRDWLWRAPAFAALEGAFEMLASLALISLGREPLGTGAAHFHDWPGMALGTVAWRIGTISLFALLLAGVVKWVRYVLLKREHVGWSDGTVRVGLPGEDFIERRANRIAESDPLTFDRRGQHNNKRG